MKLLFLDTETTGLEPFKHTVISIGALPVTLEKGKLIAETAGYELFLPMEDLKWSMGAAKVNGWPGRFEGKKVTNYAEAGNLLVQLTDGRMLAGHNVAFDIQMLDGTFATQAWRGKASHRKLDSQSLAFALVVDGLSESTGLDACSKVYPDLFDDPIGRHSALADAIASYRLAKHLLNA